MISFNTQKESTPLVLESKKSNKGSNKNFWMNAAIGVITALAIICVVFYFSADSKTATLNTDLQGATKATTPPAADDSADDGPSEDTTTAATTDAKPAATAAKDTAAAKTDAKADAGTEATEVKAEATAKDSTTSTTLEECGFFKKAWDTIKSWFGSDEECS